MILTGYAIANNFTLSTFVQGLPAAPVTGPGDGGPRGIFFTNAGDVMVTDILANSDANVYRFPDKGPLNPPPPQTPGSPTAFYAHGGALSQQNALGVTQIAAGSGFNYYMAQQGNGEVVQIAADGTFIQNIFAVPGATGIVNFPDNVPGPEHGHVFVSSESVTQCAGTGSGNSICDVDPVAKTGRVLVGGLSEPDGLTFNAGGTILYAVDHPGGEDHIKGFDLSGNLVYDSGPITKSVLGNGSDPNIGVINNVDGLLMGAGTLTGKLYANFKTGIVLEVNLFVNGGVCTSAPTSPCNAIAYNGTHGDFITGDPLIFSGGPNKYYASMLLTGTDATGGYLQRIDPMPDGGFCSFEGCAELATPEPRSFGLMLAVFVSSAVLRRLVRRSR